MAWKFKGKTIDSIDKVPKTAIGFIYKICDKDGRCYIGKKELYSKRNVEVSKNVYETLKRNGAPVTKTKNKTLSKKGEVVWRYKKKVEGESNWLEYKSSNKDLSKRNDIIKEILLFCCSKQQLTYYETKIQMIEGVLESDKWYNENILGKFFPSQTKLCPDVTGD